MVQNMTDESNPGPEDVSTCRAGVGGVVEREDALVLHMARFLWPLPFGVSAEPVWLIQGIMSPSCGCQC